MTTAAPHTASLPVLRPDVELLPGPADADGAPTYVIHDPLRGTHDLATWAQAQILGRLRTPLAMEQLLRDLSVQTTLKVSSEDVRKLCADASSRGLTLDSCTANRATGKERQSKHRPFLPERLLRRLLYFRIPLVNPDAFLERTLGLVRPLAGRAALLMYACISLLGLVLLSQQLDTYLTTFPYFFNPRGALCFALAFMGVKTVHELSHAYTAKAMGTRVPTMGMALILLFPVAYSDVTDSWRMRSRRRRLHIALAGVLAELIIGGLALCLWSLCPPGLVKSLCFVLSSAAILATLAINLNPAVRFDGYYILCDLLGIDNLQQRSFAVTRWALKRFVLGILLESPEANLRPGRLAVMVAYSIAAWCYRFFLFGGIALLLYARLAKVVGAVMFVTAVYAFIIKPVLADITGIATHLRRIGWNCRIALVTTACALVLLWAGLPLPRRQAVPAVTFARDTQVVYAPCAGVIRELDVELGTRVRRGQTLYVIRSNLLDDELRLARLEVERLRVERAAILGDDRRRTFLAQKSEELARTLASLKTIEATIEAGRVVAEFDGVVVDWDESLRRGTAVSARKAIGKIIGYYTPRVQCYVKHDLIADVELMERVCFSSDAEPAPLAGVVTNIDPVRATYLEHQGLSSLSGGDIAVVPDTLGRLETLESYYRVEVTLDRRDSARRVGQSGRVWLRSAPRSHLASLARYLYRVLLRESGF